MPEGELTVYRFQRILIVATRQIGDVLCTTPLMRRTRGLWPDAVIDVLGYERTMDMLAGNPDINEVIESPEHPNWAQYKRLIKRIFRRYDLAIVTQASDRAHLYGLLAAPRRIGIVPPSNQHAWWKKWLCDFWVQMSGADRHVIVDRVRLMEGYAGKIQSKVELQANQTVSEVVQPQCVPPTAIDLPTALTDFLNKPYIVVHATPMWRYKQWPVTHWVGLIEQMVKHGYRVVLTGSQGVKDRELNQAIYAGLASPAQSQVRDASGTLSLGQTTSLLVGARAYVGVDTSISHQAAAVGIPTLGIFGPTSPVYFGPWPKYIDMTLEQDSVWQPRGTSAGPMMQRLGNVTIVQGSSECVPCMRMGCDDHNQSHSACLDKLGHQAVWESLRGVL